MNRHVNKNRGRNDKAKGRRVRPTPEAATALPAKGDLGIPLDGPRFAKKNCKTCNGSGKTTVTRPNTPRREELCGCHQKVWMKVEDELEKMGLPRSFQDGKEEPARAEERRKATEAILLRVHKECSV